MPYHLYQGQHLIMKDLYLFISSMPSIVTNWSFSSLQVTCGVGCQLPTSPLHLLLRARKCNECSINSSVLFCKLKLWVLLVWFEEFSSIGKHYK